MPDRALQTLTSAEDAILAQTCACGCGLALTGRQKRFASRMCCSRWWDQEHPRVNAPLAPDGPRDGTLLDCVLVFLVAHLGERFTVHQIAEAVRAFPHSVSARLSELRKRGYDIRTDARNGNSARAHRFWILMRHRG